MSFRVKPCLDVISGSTSPDTKQPLFPKSTQSVPRVIAELIFDLLSDLELARAREVSRSWNTLIFECDRLINRLTRVSCVDACLRVIRDKEAVGADDEESYDTVLLLSSIAKVQAQYDLVTANQTALSIVYSDPYEKSKALLKIAAIDPKHDLATAKVIAQTIEDESRKDLVISLIAEFEAQYDPSTAKETAATIHLLKHFVNASIAIAIKDPEYISYAKEMAYTLDYGRDEALSRIAWLEARTNLNAARVTAKSIDDRNYYKTRTLLLIAEKDPHHDLTDAKVAALSLDSNDAKAFALLEIAKLDPNYDLEEVKRIANLGRYAKDEALLEIAKFEALRDITITRTQALAAYSTEIEELTALINRKVKDQCDRLTTKIAALPLHHPELKTEILLCIAEEDPQHDITAAKVAAMAIEDPRIKIQALIAIAKLDPAHDLAEAKAAVYSRDDDNGRCFELMEIIKIEVLYDLSTAKATVLAIKNPFCKAASWLEIIKIEAQTDLASAKVTALSIDDVYTKTLALMELLKMDPRKNLASLKAIALTIEDPFFKALALLDIAETAHCLLQRNPIIINPWKWFFVENIGLDCDIFSQQKGRFYTLRSSLSRFDVREI